MRRPPERPRWAGSPPTRRSRSCVRSPGRHSSVPTSWKSRHPTTAPARSPPCSRPTSSSRSSVSWRSGNDRCSGAREAGSSRGWPTKVLGAPLLLSLALLFLSPPWAGGAPAPIAKIDIEGVISPVTLRLVGLALDRAQAQRAQAPVIQLDTPSGLERSMRAIVQRELHAEVPGILFHVP